MVESEPITQVSIVECVFPVQSVQRLSFLDLRKMHLCSRLENPRLSSPCVILKAGLIYNVNF